MASIPKPQNRARESRHRPPVLFTNMIDKVKEARLQSVFRMMADHLTRDFDCDACSLLFMDGTRIRILSWTRSSEMSTDKSFGCNSDDIMRFASIKWGTPAILIQYKLSIYFNMNRASYGAYVLSPIFLDDYIRGAVCITRDGKKTFLERDRAFLNILASKMCLVVLDTIQPS